VSLYDNGDGIHPSPRGAQIMGAYLANQFAYWFTPTPAWSAQTNTDASTVLANTCFLTDSNADGVPDNWTTVGAGGTYTLAADAGINGNRCRSPVAAAISRWPSRRSPRTSWRENKFYASIKLRFDAIPSGGYIYCHVADNTLANSIVGCPTGSGAKPVDGQRCRPVVHVPMRGDRPERNDGAKFQIGLKGASAVQLSIAQPTDC
jgi:hypothetical protein